MTYPPVVRRLLGNPRRRGAALRTDSGAVLAGVLMALLLLTLFIPPMVAFVQNEARQTVRQKRATKAFYAALAGVERALYKLKSSPGVFGEVLEGNVPAGYRFDMTYADIPSGSYAVAISSTSAPRQLAVYSAGRDEDAKEFRLIEVLLKTNALVAAIYAPTVVGFGSAKVFWGPVMALGNLEVKDSANELYPRKLARGSVTSTGGSYASRDSSSAAPNTDGLEWWSYNEAPGVPDPLPIDLDYYRGQAKLETGCPAGGAPAGSCYYTTSQVWDSPQDNAEKVYFFEAGLKLSGTKHLRGTLIVMGDFDLGGSGLGMDGYGQYVATIPATAHLEYQKNTPKNGTDQCLRCPAGYALGGGGGYGSSDDGDYNNGSAAEADDCTCHQYPGDGGLASTETYRFGSGCLAHGNDGGAPTEPISFKGFIFVKGNMNLDGSASVHGTIMSDSGAFSGGGSLSIFFDDSLDVQTTGNNLSQVSWMEKPGGPF